MYNKVQKRYRSLHRPMFPPGEYHVAIDFGIPQREHRVVPSSTYTRKERLRS